MDELIRSLLYTYTQYTNAILDKISEDFNIDRGELDKYVESTPSININSDQLIVIPDVSENDDNVKEDVIDNTKCMKITKKGKQCDYKPKPNSSFCGRHSNGI